MLRLTAPKRLRGSITVPGDKSISHRAVLFNAIAEGNARISGFLDAADPRSTLACLRALGVRIEHEGETLRVYGRGLRGLCEPADVLDCGNSGTTLRLLAGLLSGQRFFSVLTGDDSLRSRPQRRIVEPLRALGAQIDGREDGDRAPLAIRGSQLHGGSYDLPIASAQIKSALLLSCLTADGPLSLGGRIDSRDHTERMLQAMGIDLALEAGRLVLYPPAHPVFPYPVSLTVPGDPSSAAFWWVAAAIHPDAEVTTTDVCLNPTRTGTLDVLQAMGAQIEIHNRRNEGNEPVGDVTVRSSGLRGTRIDGALIPRLIDEIPVLAVAAATAYGETVIADAGELRVKETDRIAVVVEQLGAMGATIEPTADGMIIAGGGELRGADVDSLGDHRLAMALGIAALVAEGETAIHNAQAVEVSYPAFWEHLHSLVEA
ncbi:MAG: 3-phosphoshikimate 1-carboxyvinyltransferase [Herpetosiphonaceae bacterium]|nr:MAG: 3-phosphoshikimate 1-carboxyvinyltransferase [Herpetosiphonaceae bacterium]